MIEHDIIRERDVMPPDPVSMDDLLLVHTPRYTRGFMEGALEHREIRKLGLPWSKPLAHRSRLAVQGTINAALAALQDGIAGNIAGGTHHAKSDNGEGFCVFNDVAVAIHVLMRSMWVKKVLVIDCDVHQGNGTAEIFKDDNRVYTFSIHGAKNYPFRKPPSTLDIGLPDGTGDAVYLRILGDAIDRIFDDFDPDLVFYLGGIDPLKHDHFGRLSLSLKGLKDREHLVIESVINRNKPLVLLMSGGYAPTLQETVTAHAEMYKVANYLF